MKPNKKRVGERIHQIRASKDMTMEEFGSLIESSPRVLLTIGKKVIHFHLKVNWKRLH